MLERAAFGGQVVPGTEDTGYGEAGYGAPGARGVSWCDNFGQAACEHSDVGSA